MEELPNAQLTSLLNRLQILEQENTQMRHNFLQIPVSQQSWNQEPSISLPERYDGTRSKLRSFINQVKLVFELQPRKYPTDRIKVGFVGTLLTGVAAAWFCPLFETNSPLLDDFPLFVEELRQTFSDYDKATVSANKIRILRQEDRTASSYTADFRLLASDLDWNENALIDQYRRGLNDSVKDLLITFPLPTTLSEAISTAVKCDNRIRERNLERSSQNYEKIYNFASDNNAGEPTPMEVDGAIKKKFLSVPRYNSNQEERNRRIKMNLCLYCGAPGHRVRNCPKKHPEALNREARLH